MDAHSGDFAMETGTAETGSAVESENGVYLRIGQAGEGDRSVLESMVMAGLMYPEADNFL